MDTISCEIISCRRSSNCTLHLKPESNKRFIANFLAEVAGSRFARGAAKGDGCGGLTQEPRVKVRTDQLVKCQLKTAIPVAKVLS